MVRFNQRILPCHSHHSEGNQECHSHPIEEPKKRKKYYICSLFFDNLDVVICRGVCCKPFWPNGLYPQTDPRK